MDGPVSRLQRIRAAIDEHQGRLIGFAARHAGIKHLRRTLVPATPPWP
jgi:hypothetical protein